MNNSESMAFWLVSIIQGFQVSYFLEVIVSFRPQEHEEQKQMAEVSDVMLGKVSGWAGDDGLVTKHRSGDTVDGRNPAPPRMIIPLFIGF